MSFTLYAFAGEGGWIVQAQRDRVEHGEAVTVLRDGDNAFTRLDRGIAEALRPLLFGPSQGHSISVTDQVYDLGVGQSFDIELDVSG